MPYRRERGRPGSGVTTGPDTLATAPYVKTDDPPGLRAWLLAAGDADGPFPGGPR